MPEQAVEDRKARAKAGKYLTFVLASESYGLEILKVRELIGLMPITVVPQTPSYVKGVINLRGKVIPIVDLRVKFGLAEAAATKETCIVVVDIRGQLVGIVVDTVSEVLFVPEANIEPPPPFGRDLDTDFILGVAKCDGKVKLLLDLDRAVGDELVIRA